MSERVGGDFGPEAVGGGVGGGLAGLQAGRRKGERRKGMERRVCAIENFDAVLRICIEREGSVPFLGMRGEYRGANTARRKGRSTDEPSPRATPHESPDPSETTTSLAQQDGPYNDDGHGPALVPGPAAP